MTHEMIKYSLVSQVYCFIALHLVREGQIFNKAFYNDEVLLLRIYVQSMLKS